MKTRLLLSLLVVFIAVAGCNSPQRYGRNKQAGQQWLAAQTQPAKINISGNWKSGEWGDAVFGQGNRRVNGQIDQYTVYGTVSGSKAYLLISETDWIYYCAELSMPDKNTLRGYYSKSVPFNSAKQEPMVLHRAR